MYGRYSIYGLLLCVGFSLGSISPQAFFLCNQTLDDTVRVDRGEDINVSVTVYGKFISLSNVNFALIHENQSVQLCKIIQQGKCVSTIDPHFHVTLFKKFTQIKTGWIKIFRFQLTIYQVDYNDTGIYVLRSSQPFCTILRLNVIVMGNLPQCTALLDNGKGHLEFSCTSEHRAYTNKMQLIARNQTLKLYENCVLISGSETANNSMSKNSAMVISTTVAIRDAFERDRIPNTCIVSNAVLDLPDQCHFSVFTSPKAIEITEFGQEVNFTCCTKSEKAANIWWYDVKRNEINATGQFFTVNIDSNLRQEVDSDDGTKSLIFLMYDDDTRLSFCIGKLALNVRYHGGVMLFGKIELGLISTVANGQRESCTRSNVMSVRAIPQEYEQRHPTSTQACQGNVTNAEDEIKSTSQVRFIGIFTDRETGISVIVVVAAFVFFIIAICVYKICSKVITLKKASTTEGNQNGNKFEISLPLRTEEEANEMTSEFPLSLTELENIAHQVLEESEHSPDNPVKYTSKIQESTVSPRALFGVKFNPAGKQSSDMGVIAQELEEAFWKRSPARQDKNTHESETGAYRNQSGKCLAMKAPIGIQSIGDDGRPTCSDLPSSPSIKHWNGVADSDTTQEEEEDTIYMNKPTKERVPDPDCVYSMPEKTWSPVSIGNPSHQLRRPTRLSYQQ